MSLDALKSVSYVFRENKKELLNALLNAQETFSNVRIGV